MRQLAQKHGVSAIKTLAEIMNNKKAPAASRIAAANVLLDRGFGMLVGDRPDDFVALRQVAEYLQDFDLDAKKTTEF